MPKLIVGELYVDLARRPAFRSPMAYIGEASTKYVFEVGSKGDIVIVMKSRAATDVVPYVEPLGELEPGTRWARTRNDHPGMVAEVILPPFEYEGKSYVVFTQHGSYGTPGPLLKTEKDFRRIYGRKAE
jgi:hypothetical protein